MNSMTVLVFGVIFCSSALANCLSALAKEPGFYVNGVSANTEEGARLFVEDLKAGGNNVCYEGHFESALDAVHSSITLETNRLFGEGENPDFDLVVNDTDSYTFLAAGIVRPCK